MYDKGALYIISVVLLLVAGLLVPYLFGSSRNNLSKNETLSASDFLILGSLFLLLCLLSLSFLGVNNIILAVALALGFALSLLHPVPATCFLLAVIFLRPWEAFTNPLLDMLPRLMVGVASLSWMLHAVRTRSDRLLWSPPCWYFVGLCVWLLICSLVSTTSSESLQFYFDNFVRIMVFTFLIVNSIRERKDLALLTQTLVISILGIIGVALHITLRDYAVDERYFRLHGIGLWGNANDLATLVAIVLPLLLRPHLKKVSGNNTALWATIFSLVAFCALLWTQSRGAILAVLAGTFSYFVFCGRSRRIALLGVFAISILPFVFYIMPQRDELDLSGSSSSRANYLIAGINMAKHSPIFGVGINNYSPLYEQFTPAFIEWGTRTAHSSWVLFLAESGVIGLLLFCGLYFSVLGRTWALRKKEPYLFLMVLVYGVAMSFLSHSYLFLPYVLFAYVLAAARIETSVNAVDGEERSQDEFAGIVSRRYRMGVQLQGGD